MDSFKGRVFAVTGAATGIGRSTAQLLAKRGATLSLCDINIGELQMTLQSLEGDAANYMITQVDVSKSQQVNAWIEATVAKFGRLDGAANIAGAAPRAKPLRDVTDAEWGIVMAVNADGVFYSMRAQIPQMNQDSCIVNCTSVAGLTGSGGTIEYSASKHAVVGMTKVAAREEGHNGIRINAVAPGAIDTPMMKELEGKFGVPKEQFPLADRVQKRYADVAEVAHVILFMLSKEASFVTGSIWTVDGGWTTL